MKTPDTLFLHATTSCTTHVGEIAFIMQIESVFPIYFVRPLSLSLSLSHQSHHRYHPHISLSFFTIFVSCTLVWIFYTHFVRIKLRRTFLSLMIVEVGDVVFLHVYFTTNSLVPSNMFFIFFYTYFLKYCTCIIRVCALYKRWIVESIYNKLF